MQGSIRCVFVAGCLLGCQPGGIGAQDDAPDLDATLGPSGIRVAWSSTPVTWPGALGDSLTLTEAHFALNSLRVVGDAGPGDPRTTIGNMEMGFDAATRPTDITFDDAPTGLYSQVAIVFDRTSSGSGSDDSYDIRGLVTIDDDEVEYRIQDDKPLTFNVNIDEMVSPGESAVISLRINFQHALESLDFEMLELDNGRRELQDGDPQMPLFRSKLVESFEVIADPARGTGY